MDLFKGVGLLTERWVKGKLKVIASELGIPYSGKFSKYVLIDKFHYHLIEYLYGVPHPDLAKYDSPSRALNFVNLIKDLDKDKKSPLYIYMHYHTSGNAFSKRVIEKVKAEAEAIDTSASLLAEKIMGQLLLQLEIVLKEFDGDYLIVMATPESSLDKESNKKIYFHEAIHVLLNENDLHFDKGWYYNEGLVTYFQAEHLVKGEMDMAEKIRLLRGMLEGQDPKYFEYAHVWDAEFNKYSGKPKIEVIKMMLQAHG